MVSLKRSHFSTYHCVFFPTVVQILVGRLTLDSCFLTHTKKYMTPIHALNFENMSKCVFILDILKSQCKFITLWGSTCSKTRLAGRSFFQNLGCRVQARKPRWEFKGSALEPFFHVILRLNGALIV